MDPERQAQVEAMIAAIQSMDGESLATMMPQSPDPSVYLGEYQSLSEVEVRDVVVDGPHGVVPCRLYQHSPVATGAAMVWVHGGGFVGGDLDMPEAHWVSLMLAAAGVGVLSVDYRKCVQAVHYPIPSDDVMAAWEWAMANVDELGATRNRLHLGGASAGASLAAGVAKRLRDGGGDLPASLVLAYPTLYADPPVASGATPDPMAMGVMRFMNRNYAGSDAALEDPYAFPGLGDVGRLPQTYILNSDNDGLRASGESFAVALAEAGVDVVVEFEPETGHGHLNEPLLPAAVKSIERISTWLNR